jgi:hypothetical protein
MSKKHKAVSKKCQLCGAEFWDVPEDGGLKCQGQNCGVYYPTPEVMERVHSALALLKRIESGEMRFRYSVTQASVDALYKRVADIVANPNDYIPEAVADAKHDAEMMVELGIVSAAWNEQSTKESP